MKKFAIFLTALAVALTVSLPARAQFGNLSYHSAKVTSISLAGFTSVNGSVKVDISNDGGKLTISGISGTLYRNGSEFFRGKANDIVIPQGRKEIVISGTATLCSFTSLFSVFSMRSGFNFSGYTADVVMTVTDADGNVLKIEKKGIDVSAYLGN